MIDKFDDILTALTSETEFSKPTRKILSLVFLLCASFFCFLTYTRTIIFGFQTSFSMTPGLIEALISLALIAPLYLRGILKWSNSIFGIISLILISLVFASFVSFAFGGTYGSKYSQAMILSAILLSWVGIRPLAGIAWLLALAAAIFNIIHGDIQMGFNGFIYILSSFLGLLFHSGLNPGTFVRGLSEEYGSGLKKTEKIRTTIKSDIDNVL